MEGEGWEGKGERKGEGSGRGKEEKGGGVMAFGDGYPWEGRGKGEGGKIGEDPQCLKCVDANVHVHNYNVCIILFLCTL